MSFDHITFKHTNSSVREPLQLLISEKLQSLKKFVDDTATVEVEIEGLVSHASGKNCRIEVNIRHKGSFYRAEATEATFEAALDIARDQLSHEMQTARGRKHSLVRRGARKIKEMVRFGR